MCNSYSTALDVAFTLLMGSSRCCQGAFDYFDSDDDGMLVGSEIIEVPKKEDKSGEKSSPMRTARDAKGHSSTLAKVLDFKDAILMWLVSYKPFKILRCREHRFSSNPKCGHKNGKFGIRAKKRLPSASRPSENSFKDFLFKGTVRGVFHPLGGFYGSFEALEPLLPRLPDEQQLRNALCLGGESTDSLSRKCSNRVTSGRVGCCLCHESWMALKKRIPWMALEGLQGLIASIGEEQVFRYWAYMAWSPMFYQVGEAMRYPD